MTDKKGTKSITIRVSDEVYDRINDYKAYHGLPNFSAALKELLKFGGKVGE